MPDVKLFFDGCFETVRIESRRYCQDCQYWTPKRCELLGVELPGYASPARPVLCLSAEKEAEARERVK
jgi:hypothetical protein